MKDREYSLTREPDEAMQIIWGYAVPWSRKAGNLNACADIVAMHYGHKQLAEDYRFLARIAGEHAKDE